MESVFHFHTRPTIPGRAKRVRAAFEAASYPLRTAGHGGGVDAGGSPIPCERVPRSGIESAFHFHTHTTIPGRAKRVRAAFEAASYTLHTAGHGGGVDADGSSIPCERVPRSGIGSAFHVHTRTTIPGRAKRLRAAFEAASYPLHTAGHGGGVDADGSSIPCERVPR